MAKSNTLKNVFRALLLAMTLVVAASCGNDPVKNFVTEFATAYATGDSIRMVQLYPDSKSFTMAKPTSESFDVNVEPVEGNEDAFKATLNGSIELTIKKSGESYVIESSRGLLKLPEDMTFAQGTGQYKAELTDVENAQRLSDDGFMKWVLNDVVKDIDKKVKIVNNSNTIISRHATEWFDEEHNEPMSERYTSEIKITVQNNLDTDINADAYSVVSSVYIYGGDFDSRGELGTKCAKTTNVQTKTIEAHSSTVLTYTYSGEGDQIEGFGWIDHVKSVLSFNLQNLNVSALYTPRGGEYEEYMMNHPVSDSNNDSELNIVLHGKIGGDAASTFTLNGQEGSYIFVGASRQSKLVSYDSQTGKLIVDAYLNGLKIGFFDGIYANGRYKGIFKNTRNGAKLNFNLTE